MSDDLAALEAQLTNLKEAYYAGTRRLGYEGKNVDYGSPDEMRQAITQLETAINNLTGAQPVRTIAVRSTKGW
jgi:hypothetical protein